MISALDSLARVAAGRIVNSVAAGIILTILAWSLLRLLPRLNARTRVAVWLSVLVAIPGLSIASFFMGNTSSTLASQSARIIVPEGWAFAIFIAWGSVASLGLLRVGFGLWRIRLMRRACRPVNLAQLDPIVLSTVQDFHPGRPVALLESATAGVPMAIGFFRPAVILPKWVLTEHSANEISAILIHEFAHLRRCDDWINFFQKLVRTVFFFHPSIWWVDRQLALDREIVCDDAVLAATNKAHDYARCLVGLAEKNLVRKSVALAQAAVHRVQHISVRISQILDSSRPRATRVSRIALAGATGLAGICLIALLQSPTLIAFQDTDAATAGSAIRGYKASSVATAASAVRPAEGSESGLAKVVPATLHERVTPTPRLYTRAKKANVVAAYARPQNVVVPAKFILHAEQQSKVFGASLSIHQQTVVPVENILFVMPEARFDDSGRVVWTLSVWRLTVFHPVRAPVQGVISNSI
jgi:beta-lactamase regulating signal transducer with metallopeptidase domain